MTRLSGLNALLAATTFLAGACAPVAAQAQDHPHDRSPDPGQANHSDHDHSGHGHSWGHGYRPGYARPTARFVDRTRVVVDRSRGGWWRGDPGFYDYRGERPGFYFAPGYGYYAIPRGYADRAFVAGVALPIPMRRYGVAEPDVYGLRPPPRGYGWYYAGSSFVLASVATGMIVQAIAGGW
jgi:Ni/Co efflux regulator RcnB